jgi:phosphopantetheinyl transferase (holo-ACP synthase)
MQLGGTAVHLSISHSREHAVAMAIVEGATHPPAPDFWPEIG